MSDYLEDLKAVIKRELYDYASNLEKIKNKEVRNVEWLNVMSIDGMPEKTSKLFSGKEITITPRGAIRFLERIPNGARGVTMDFWALNMKISFNSDEEEFEVDEIGNFGAFD